MNNVWLKMFPTQFPAFSHAVKSRVHSNFGGFSCGGKNHDEFVLLCLKLIPCLSSSDSRLKQMSSVNMKYR